MFRKLLAFAAPLLVVSPLLIGCGADLDDGDEDVADTHQGMHSWGNYHWARQSNPFTVTLLDAVNSTWDPYLVTASNDWTASQVLNTTIVANAVNPKTCKPTAGKVQVCNAAYGQNGWLGIAQIWLSGGHISQGVVKLNDTYYASATYNKPAWRALVMCQEIGHTFGLAHNDEDFNTTNGTCMDYSNDPNPNQHPDQHDYQQLESIYAHLDSNTTVINGAVLPGTQLPPALGNADFSAMEHWGNHESSDASGHIDTFVRDFGEWTLITTATWADHDHVE
jgi:hypothetical protein